MRNPSLTVLERPDWSSDKDCIVSGERKTSISIHYNIQGILTEVPPKLGQIPCKIRSIVKRIELPVLFPFVWEIKIKRWVARLEGPHARPQRKGAHWGMGGARTTGGGSRDRTRHFPSVKNPHKMQEVRAT